MINRAVAFLAIILTAVVLVPEGAHLFEMPGKMRLDRDAYFAVQQIYAGWAFFGAVLLAALLTTFVFAARLRGDWPAFVFAAVAFAAVVANLAIFFAFTFPENQATANWTTVHANWEALRARWEYSHAANAGVMFIGFCSATLAALTASRG